MRQLKIQQSVTDRSGPLDRYMREVNSLPMISPEEETDLAYRILSGDDMAFQKLVEANLRFVISVAKQYQGNSMELSDLINEGNIGLMKAVSKYDPSRGFKFISYAVWWIRQSIMQALGDNGRMVRLPLNQVSAINKIRKASAAFLQENEREPTEAELAAITELPEFKVIESLTSAGSHVSFDKPISDGNEGTMLDIMPDDGPRTDESVDRESLRTDIDQVLMVLNTRERDIIRLAFGLGCQELTLEEIGDRYDLTRERVRQVKEKAIRKLSRSEVCSRLIQYR